MSRAVLTARDAAATVWSRVWGGQPPGGWLSFFGAVVAFVMAVPIAFVVWRSAFAGVERWARLLDDRVPSLLWSTLSLAGAVTVAAGLLGTVLALLVHRTDVPGRRVWRWLLAVPLAVPPYVGAMAYIVIFGPRGWIARWAGSTPIDMYSFFGAFFVLTVFTYPYVYLVVGGALARIGGTHEEAARSLGLSPQRALTRVTVPMLRPAIGAGGILVMLYVLSDFGAVATVRYTTFTSAIYYQMGGFDTASATVLSVVLIALTLVVLFAEGFTRRKMRAAAEAPSRPAEPVELGRWRAAAAALLATVCVVALVAPVGVLVYWSWVGASLGAFDQRFWGYVVNTALACGIAAVLAMVAALPVVYLRSRHPSPASTVIEKLAYAGYALPGVIVAIGLIALGVRYTPLLYGTVGMLALAYVVRFAPQAMQSVAASLSTISPRIDEAARIQGLSPAGVLARVVLPLVAPGALAGGALVFVSAAKELPATLLLRPIGFDTLAVRVWVESSEALYHLAAPPALLIVAISALPLKFLLDRFGSE